MWKHEIIMHAQKNAVEMTKNIIIKDVREAIVFHIGDIENLSSLQNNIGLENRCHRLPYKKCLFEFKVDKNIRVVVLAYDKPELNQAWFRTYICFEDSKIGWINDDLYLIGYDYTAEEIQIMEMTGQKYKFSSVKDVFPEIKNISLGQYEGFSFEAYAIIVLDCFFRLLECKNTIIKKVVPPAKLNKSRLKHKKEPLYEYNIVEISATTTKIRYAGEVDWDYRSPENVAFHMCRGHFKTYTKDAPLFGKYVGTFWWQPQARGTIDEGIIEKEYFVTD